MLALRSPWVVHGDVAEGLAWFGRFLALDERVAAGVRARALMLSAELAFEYQDYADAARTAQAAVAMCTAYPAACPAGGLRILALISLRAGLVEQALARADAAVAAARQHADEWEEGLAHAARAAILARSGQLASAQSAFEVALELLTGNNGWGVAHALYGSAAWPGRAGITRARCAASAVRWSFPARSGPGPRWPGAWRHWLGGAG